MNWYLAVLKNYAGFSGRARRTEYWMFTLISVLISIGLSIIDKVVFGNIGDSDYGVIYLLYSLAVFIPGLAVMVRRLHDVGKSGWFFFIILIPIAGFIWLLVLLCTEGEGRTNEYGKDPKGFDEFQTEFA